MNYRLKAAGLPRCKDVGSKASSQPGGPRGPADFQLKSFKKLRFFDVFWLREASVSQSGPDRALGKLAENLYQRKLLIRRDLESLS